MQCKIWLFFLTNKKMYCWKYNVIYFCGATFIFENGQRERAMYGGMVRGGMGVLGFSAGGEDPTGRLLMVSRSGVLDYLPSQGLMTTLLYLQLLYITTHCSWFSWQQKYTLRCAFFYLIWMKSFYSVTIQPCDFASSDIILCSLLNCLTIWMICFKLYGHS